MLEEETHQKKYDQQIITEEDEGGSGSHNNSPRTNLEIQLNGGEITQNKQLNKSERKALKLCRHGRTSFNTTCPHLHNRIQDMVDGVTAVNQQEGKTHQRKTQQQSKPKDIQKANINDSSRPERSGD